MRQLATNQAVLYGVRTICCVPEQGGGTRRIESRLTAYSHTADNPMGWVYDPCDLDFTLRVFRAERKAG